MTEQPPEPTYDDFAQGWGRFKRINQIPQRVIYTQLVPAMPLPAPAEIPVVCTDRGQHNRVPITVVKRSEPHDGQAVLSMSLPPTGRAWWGPPDPDADAHSGASRTSFTFNCPKCSRRNVEVKRDRWWTGAQDALDAHLPEIDVSLLS